MSLGRFAILAFFFITLFLSSCGSINTKYETIKDYRIAVMPEDVEYSSAVETMIREFNTRSGGEAIHLVRNLSEANSYIDIVDSLTQRNNDHKVGYGQWILEQDQEPKCNGCLDRKVTNRYTMKMELDKTFFSQRYKNNDQLHGGELFNLFAHETGHGLMMDHDPNPKSVMYSQVGGVKDYDKFFNDVRAFFQARD